MLQYVIYHTLHIMCITLHAIRCILFHMFIEVGMNFNIYLNENLVKELKAIVASTKKRRNAIIQEAVREFVTRYHKKQWSKYVQNFSGIKELQRREGFEKTRDELKIPQNDIF